MDAFLSKLSYSFKDTALLAAALTHSSYYYENSNKVSSHNERLEFLGDAVLELTVSDYLYNRFTKLTEGELTKFRASVVCETTLARISKSIGLGAVLMLGRGEDISGGRERDSILADALEAVIGAVYIDGGLEEAYKFIINLLSKEINYMHDRFKLQDSKTYLQEIIQQNSKLPIIYSVTDEKGPDHNKMFTVHVTHDNKILGVGVGKSKKEAEQNAAVDAVNKVLF